jgi:hypothetical protein
MDNALDSDIAMIFSGQGADSDEGGGGGGRDRAESGGWIDLGKDDKLALVRLFSTIVNPVLWIRDPLEPGFGMGKKSRSGSGMNRIIFTRAWKQFFGLKILKFFDTDPGF